MEFISQRYSFSLFHFPRFSELFSVPERPEERLLAELQKYQGTVQVSLSDSPETLDTAYLRQKLDSLLAPLKRIQYPPSVQSDFLHPLFQKLRQRKRVRILHYGDSQIEGDRITAYIRNQLQKQFGGRGPGLIPAIPVAPLLHIRHEWSDHWIRLTGYTASDTTELHRKLGPLLTAGLAQIQDSLDTAWILLRPRTGIGYWRALAYSYMILYLGIPDTSNPHLEVWMNDSVQLMDTALHPAEWVRIEAPVKPRASLLLRVWGGPILLYAISLEFPPEKGGVIVDNIPLRGSAGTIFTRQNRAFFQKVLTTLDPDLILLQFGGNVVPYIRSDEQCNAYGKRFARQLRWFQSFLPDVRLLVLGPADMATRVEGKLQTYPWLECVRDALKHASFQEGALFWDMYLNMGGAGTIIQWVENAEPPLAAPDYIHFTPAGVREISRLFWEDWQWEYEKFLQQHESQKNRMDQTMDDSVSASSPAHP